FRDLVCETKDSTGSDKISKNPAECKLFLRETGKDDDPNDNRREVPGKGCFDEVVNGTVRTYCDLLCPNADTVYVIKRDPQNHRSCFEFLTYKREKRQDEWYFWRQEKCRNATITFKLRCEFLFPRKEFPDDTEIFKKFSA
ncbi:unnamed protein product, partial [Dracunculus medinensis]|uniref:Salivary lipocalin lipocalin n=1 Tax=Dracunculus medinensis TaxID=318479 RepID=A0A0N4UP95_DRAME